MAPPPPKAASPLPAEGDTPARPASPVQTAPRHQLARDHIALDLVRALADDHQWGVTEVVRPMRLYGYIASKVELLDLMVDAVHAEIRPVGDGWREMLRSLAEATRHAAHEHEWLADLLGGRPQLGPHALASGETVVAALGGVDVDAIMPVVAAVNTYAIGAVRRKVAERRAERATGMDERRWQASLGPCLERTFATGRFPALATVVRDAAHLDADHTFRIGLHFLLDGIAARISR
ncbi:TetR/AcrR family transcriptional regulator C-terminal domain-containing protein [Streptomyces avermitilis]|uniref:TetR/AcrR family transcriptional regulator C-terminal domain-containing protein n=1 Tax=Streptomyces avermitilis TaxID=33903 RepID=UPI003F54096B